MLAFKRKRTLRDRLREWLIAPINDDLTMNRRILNQVLANIVEVRRTMVTEEQVNTFVEGLSSEISKIGDDLLAHLTDLKTRIEQGQDFSSVFEKLKGIGNQLQAVDDLIPERPASTPTPVDTAPLPTETTATETASASAEPATGATAPADEAKPADDSGSTSSSESSGS